jgi:hypothetical protein
MTFRIGFGRAVPALVLAAATMIGGGGPAGAGTAAPQLAAAHATPPPALTVTPTSGLVDDQSVTVGAVAGADTYALCPTVDAANPDQCTYLSSPEPGGSSVVVRVPARIVVISDADVVSFVDCRTTSCSLVAISYPMDSDGPVVVGASALAFNPAGALRTPPSLTVTPQTGLVDGQSVAVSVSPAGNPESLGGTNVYQCTTPVTTLDDLVAASASCAFDTVGDLSGPEGGTAVGTIEVRAYINTPTGPVDCRAATATCVLFTLDPVFQTSNVPLTFDEHGAVQPAFLSRPSVEPYGTSTSTYDLVGFTPNDPFHVNFCNADGACLSTVITSGTLDGTGMANFDLDDPFPEDAPEDFCATWCALQATDAHGLSALNQDRLSIIGEPIPPEGPFRSKQHPVTVKPNKDLHDGDTVTVTASGFEPGASVSIVECNGSAVTVGAAACDLNTSSFLDGTDLTVDAQGNVSATYAITRHITTPKDGPLDCATSNVNPDAYAAGVAADPSRAPITAPGYFSCVIVVADISDYTESGGAAFAFAGAKFRRLPWEVEPRRAAPATPIAAQPTFTG